VVSEDRTEQDEQDRLDDQDSSSPRPATAAARRERRTAGTSPAGRAGAGTESRPLDVKGRPTPAAGRREERVNPVALIARFMREVVAELRKVIWPTRKELVTYTIVVLVFVSFMVALVGVLDIAFAKGVFWLFG
jgi:preprotein translocase subunit SecE